MSVDLLTFFCSVFANLYICCCGLDVALVKCLGVLDFKNTRCFLKVVECIESFRMCCWRD